MCMDWFKDLFIDEVKPIVDKWNSAGGSGGSGGSGPSVQSDWNQNDENAPDYVKNRPFYDGDTVEVTLLDAEREIWEDGASVQVDCGLVDGQSYIVVFDGELYECVAHKVKISGETALLIGNLSVMGIPQDTGEPFLISSYKDLFEDFWWWEIITKNYGNHTIIIKTVQRESVKIDKRFLPDVEVDLSGKMDSENPTGYGAFSMNRDPDTQTGDNSHAEGNWNAASGYASHAEGSGTTASGEISHTEGNSTTASGMYSHAEGWDTVASASAAHVEGYESVAAGNYSHAEGRSTTTNDPNTKPDFDRGLGGLKAGEYTHAEGLHTVAYGICAHAEGERTWAYGDYSHAEGRQNEASGPYSHVEGQANVASGYHSHAEGYRTIAAGRVQHVQGEWNIEDTASKYVHIVGNGTLVNSTRSNAHTLDWDGNATFAGSVTGSGADYAEYFEWFDGNPNDEDRIGLVVTLEGDKIRLANVDDDVLGVVTGTAMIIGDNAEWEWRQKYLVDDYGRVITEMVEDFTEVPNKETGEVEKVSLGFFHRPKMNPEFDSTKDYVRRSDRPEWETVGMLGKIHVTDDGTCVVGGYATVSANGIVTASVEKTNMRVMKRITDKVVLVLMK